STAPATRTSSSSFTDWPRARSGWRFAPRDGACVRRRELALMARAQSRYVCQACGAVAPKWAGRCESCGEWNTLVEEAAAEAGPPKGRGRGRGKKLDFVGLSGTSAAAPRRVSGIAEFDRVCGGGLVPGSAILVGGDPGIGKSTLLLQVAARL